MKTSRTWQKRQRVFWGHLIKPVISFIHEVYWILDWWKLNNQWIRSLRAHILPPIIILCYMKLASWTRLEKQQHSESSMHLDKNNSWSCEGGHKSTLTNHFTTYMFQSSIIMLQFLLSYMILRSYIFIKNLDLHPVISWRALILSSTYSDFIFD